MFLAVLLFLSISFSSLAHIVGSTTFKGKTYFVDVIVSGTSATIWLRTNQNMCTTNDIRVLQLSASNSSLKSAGVTICRAKRVYDAGKTIAGCLSIAASGACAAATVATEGAAAAFCSAVFVYSVDYGVRNCIDGVSNNIANYLGASPWASFAIKAGLTTGKFSSVIDTAIDSACQDIK